MWVPYEIKRLPFDSAPSRHTERSLIRDSFDYARRARYAQGDADETKSNVSATAGRTRKTSAASLAEGGGKTAGFDGGVVIADFSLRRFCLSLSHDFVVPAPSSEGANAQRTPQVALYKKTDSDQSLSVSVEVGSSIAPCSFSNSRIHWRMRCRICPLAERPSYFAI